MLISIIAAAVVGYLLGALPFGYWVARAKGINIFEHGSKNPGATNVRRVLGKGPGNLVFALDAFKGALAAGWTLALPGAATKTVVDTHAGSVTPTVGYAIVTESISRTEFGLTLAVVGLAAALIGHAFSCFTGFRGGKGVATTAGGFLVVMPLVIVIATLVWIVIFYTLRYVSLASILAGFSLPVSAWLLDEPHLALGLAFAIAVFVAIRHRANIVRLLNGTENRFVKKPPLVDSPKT